MCRFERRLSARGNHSSLDFFRFQWDFLTRRRLFLTGFCCSSLSCSCSNLHTTPIAIMSSAQQRLAAVSSSLSHPKGLLAGEVAIITGVSSILILFVGVAYSQSPPSSGRSRYWKVSRSPLCSRRSKGCRIRLGPSKGSNCSGRDQEEWS